MTRTETADRLLRGAAAIQTALAGTWIAMGVVDLRCVDYGMTFGAGQMLGYQAWVTRAVVIFAGSALTIGFAVESARGKAYALRWSAVMMAVALTWAAPRIHAGWPGSGDWVQSHPPGWFTVLSRGYPTFVASLVALALLATAAVLRRNLGPTTDQPALAGPPPRPKTP